MERATISKMTSFSLYTHNSQGLQVMEDTITHLALNKPFSLKKAHDYLVSFRLIESMYLAGVPQHERWQKKLP